MLLLGYWFAVIGVSMEWVYVTMVRQTAATERTSPWKASGGNVPSVAVMSAERSWEACEIAD